MNLAMADFLVELTDGDRTIVELPEMEIYDPSTEFEDEA